MKSTKNRGGSCCPFKVFCFYGFLFWCNYEVCLAFCSFNLLTKSLLQIWCQNYVTFLLCPIRFLTKVLLQIQCQNYVTFLLCSIGSSDGSYFSMVAQPCMPESSVHSNDSYARKHKAYFLFSLSLSSQPTTQRSVDLPFFHLQCLCIDSIDS